MLELNKIHLKDSTELIKSIPDKYFDLLLTDPPYGIDYMGQISKKGAIGAYGWANIDTSKQWDKKSPDEEMFKEFLRVSKQQIIWGGNYFADKLPPSQGWLVWNKGQRNFSLADGELAWTSFDNALRIFDYSRAKFQSTGERIHPTQKPEALFEWCLRIKKIQKGAKIFDPYSGSGTTAVVCEKLGFEYLCIEKDPDYHKGSLMRLEEAKRQLRFAI